jgi:hypothetical protein
MRRFRSYSSQTFQKQGHDGGIKPQRFLALASSGLKPPIFLCQ